MSRGAIFNWFPSKEELFIAIAARDNARLLHLFAEEGLEAILDALPGTIPTGSPSTSSSARLLNADPELRERGRRSRRTTHGSAAGLDRGGAVRRSDALGRLGAGDRPVPGRHPRRHRVQRALGFDAPSPELLHLLTSDAVAGARDRALASD